MRPPTDRRLTRPPALRPGATIDLDRCVRVVDGGRVRVEPLGLLITRPTVLTVVPAAGLRDGDHQLAGLAAAAPTVRASGFGVLAVARAGPSSVADTVRALGLDVATIDDADGSLAEGLGVAPPTPCAVVVVDGLGTVRAWHAAVPHDHGRQILAVVRALHTDRP